MSAAAQITAQEPDRSDLPITADFADARIYGTDASGLQKALNSASYVFLGEAEYTIDRPLIVPPTCKAIVGRGATIRYSHEQTDDLWESLHALFNLAGCTGTLISGLNILYTGPMDDGDDDVNDGRVSGIFLWDTKNVTIRDCAISGFNASGIVIGESLGTEHPADQTTVENCVITQNRNAGIWVSKARGTRIIGNNLSRNGLPGDSSTGYGVTLTGYGPVNTSIVNNQASYNLRKGIDAHAGKNILISGNTCLGNKKVGIYLMSGKPMGQVNIVGNTVSDMVGDEFAHGSVDGLIAGSLTGYAPAPDQDPFTLNIVGNVFLDILSGTSQATVMQIFCDGMNQGRINLSDNQVRCSQPVYIGLDLFGGSAPAHGADFYDISINNNVFDLHSAYSVILFDSYTDNWRRAGIIGNRISLSSLDNPVAAAGAISLIKGKNPQRMATVARNTILAPGEAWPGTFQDGFDLAEDQLGVYTANKVNGEFVRDWDGRFYTWSAGGAPSSLGDGRSWTAGSIIHSTQVADKLDGQDASAQAWVCIESGTPGQWEAIYLREGEPLDGTPLSGGPETMAPVEELSGAGSEEKSFAGDLNQDEAVDIQDAVLAMKILTRGPEALPEKAARDSNQIIGPAQLVYILQKAAGLR